MRSWMPSCCAASRTRRLSLGRGQGRNPRGAHIFMHLHFVARFNACSRLLRFKYDPTSLEAQLFPPSSALSRISTQASSTPAPSAPAERAPSQPRRRKRRRLNNGAPRVSGGDMDVDSDYATTDAGTDTGAGAGAATVHAKDVMLENDEERFLLAAVPADSSASASAKEADKENRDVGADRVTGKRAREGRGLRYNLYLVKPPPPPSLPESPGAVHVNGKTNGVEAKKDAGSTPKPPDGEPTAGKKLTNGTHEPPPDESTTAASVMTATNKAANKGKANGTGMDVDSTPAPAPAVPSAGKKQELQLLHRDLGAEALDFREGGLAIVREAYGVAEDGSAALVEAANAKAKGWFVRVQRWRWTRENSVL